MRTNFQMTDENITLVTGDTLSFNIIVKDEYGNPVDVDDASFSVASSLTASSPLVHKTLDNGISQSGGVLTVRVAPEDWDGYVGFAYYDCQIEVNNDRFTLLRGMIQLEADV